MPYIGHFKDTNKTTMQNFVWIYQSQFIYLFLIAWVQLDQKICSLHIQIKMNTNNPEWALI